MTTKQRLSAKRIRELLAFKKVHNDFGLVGDTQGKQPVITFRSGYKKRNVTSAWQIITPGRSTNPDGQYRDDFNQTYETGNDAFTRERALREAQAWGTEQYGVNDWAKTPFGGWMSQAHLDTRLRELLPEHFDPDYRDLTVKKVVDKIYGDDKSGEQLFRVVIQLYAKPEPPLYVVAADVDAAYRQVTQLLTRLAGTRILDGLKLNVYDA